ncbi:S39A4-like protein [Mya arenaria]|uniref:S39A4-like protein n=1 Tax=Mya arenaria TaxID=6604 RepID=A0ABY7FFF3_MYAAR|nr:S39A4-like protein [Mya arenaria]
MSATDLYQMFNIKPSSQQHNALPTNSFLDMCPVILDLMLKGHTNCWHPFSPTHLATRTTLPSSSTTSKPPASTDGILSSSSVDIVSNTSSSLNETNEFKEETSRLHSYLFGSLATLVISLFSMFGAVFMKLSRVNIRRYLMATMLSLAVGCLVADAALHLLPEV